MIVKQSLQASVQISGFCIYTIDWKDPDAWIVPGETPNDLRKAGWTIMDMELQIKDGLVNGQGIKWYKNGQKKMKTNHKDGKLMFAEVWKPNGEKCGISTVVDGVGVIKIYGDDSTGLAIHSYRNGKLVENKILW